MLSRFASHLSSPRFFFSAHTELLEILFFPCWFFSYSRTRVTVTVFEGAGGLGQWRVGMQGPRPEIRTPPGIWGRPGSLGLWA